MATIACKFSKYVILPLTTLCTLIMNIKSLIELFYEINHLIVCTV